MSNQHYPNFGYVVEITPENIRKFDLGQVGEDFIITMEMGMDTVVADELHLDLCEAFEKKYKVCPEVVFVNDECEGLDEVESDHWYLQFYDEDKHEKTVRPEWLALPIEPKAASWASYS